MINILHRHTRELLLVYPYDSFVGEDLRGYNLEFADLSGKDLTGVNMLGMNLDETEFSDSILINARLISCSLREAIFDSTNLQGAELNACKCSMTAFTRANLTGSDLSYSELEGVTVFKDAIAIGANFRNIAKLVAPIFENTDCRRADFRGTDLTKISAGDIVGANFDGALLDRTSREYVDRILRKEPK